MAFGIVIWASVSILRNAGSASLLVEDIDDCGSGLRGRGSDSIALCFKLKLANLNLGASASGMRRDHFALNASGPGRCLSRFFKSKCISDNFLSRFFSASDIASAISCYEVINIQVYFFSLQASGSSHNNTLPMPSTCTRLHVWVYGLRG